MAIKVSALCGGIPVAYLSLFVQRRARPRVLGIVEPLEKRILLAADFGDAPLPYPVTSAEFGAQHIVGGLRFGAASVDIENDGTHSDMADFDDLTGTSDDEDGVTFGTIQVGALDATVMVNVQGAPGKLDAWIDFNRDGSWGGPGEKIFARQDVTVGENVLRFDVPSFAVAGTTFARFRLSTAGGLGPRGQASDGEVEDHQLTIKGPTAASGVFVRQEAINTGHKKESALATDMDGDGDMDVLSVSSSDSTIVWHENDGSQSFTPRLIRTTRRWPQDVFAADMDGDGDMDVLSGTGTTDFWVAMYENDGSQNFTEHRVADFATRSVFAADVDGDGDMDFLTNVAWHENDGSQNFTEHRVGDFAARRVFAVDMDADGDMDIVRDLRGDGIAWYENDGRQNFTTHTINVRRRLLGLFAADVDGDGDMDLVGALGGDGIDWYENDGRQGFTEHTITTETAVGIFAADVDGDGDMDVLGASSGDDKIAWYENDGSQNFTTHTITTSAIHAVSVSAADMDGDGDLDVLNSSLVGNTIEWYEQRILGDANNDGVFDSTDLTTVFQIGKYEDAIDDNATFDEGDWNQDGDFDSSDLVLAFQAGNYVAAARPLVAEIAGAIDWLFAQDDDLPESRAFVA